MACCKAGYSFDIGWCRELPVVDYKDDDGNEYCVFHAPVGKKGVSKDEFQELVFERIQDVQKKNEEKGKSNLEGCNLSGTVFEWGISFNRFRKNNPLPLINFSKAAFQGDTYFDETAFNGEAGFFRTDFSGNAYFVGAAFSCEVYFNKTNFIGDAYFIRAVFSDKVNFSGSKFDGNVSFMEATFNGEANFTLSIFNADTNFSGVAFNKVFFRRTAFGEFKVLINDITVEDVLEFVSLDFTKTSFDGTDFGKIKLINPTWPMKGNRDVLYDEILLDEERPGDSETIERVKSLYNSLKQKYKNEHDQAQVSNWHYGEKEMERKMASIKTPFHWSIINLYWLSSGYAEAPRRAGGILIALIIIFSILLGWAGLEATDAIKGTDKAIEMSWRGQSNFKGMGVLLLNTLKYATFQKDFFFQPVSWCGEAIKLLAQIFIPLQTALFALAVRNRYRR